MPALGAAAALICALSLAGPRPSHAAPPTMSATDEIGAQPCNEACKAYMAWSDRVAAMLRPTQPVAQIAVRDGKAAGEMVHHRASKARQPSLNSFAQFPVRSDAMAPSADNAPGEAAPPRPVEGIAERFPAAAGFVTAILAGPAGPAGEAPDRTVVAADNAIPPMSESSTIDVRSGESGGVDLQFVVSLLLALCALSALAVWAWSRGGTQGGRC